MIITRLASDSFRRQRELPGVAIRSSRIGVVDYLRWRGHFCPAGIDDVGAGGDDLDTARSKLLSRGISITEPSHDAGVGLGGDAMFERSAVSFDNPDHVSIVIHNYRWRLGLAEGEPKYDDLEKRLAAFPVITVPTIALQGDADGAPRPDPGAYAKKFSGKYSHRTIRGGIGHNLPQEAPGAFAKAVIDVDRF